MAANNYQPAAFNALSSNRFADRSDVAAAVQELFKWLLPYFSEGCARVQLDASGSTHDQAACDFEGFARPLFGIIPLVVGGGSFDHFNLYIEGLKNGTSSRHPEYWGAVKGKPNQRQVEATAIGLALLLIPEHIWDPLDEESQSNVAEWLLSSRNSEHVNNNHLWFRVIVDLGLERVGVKSCDQLTEDSLDLLEQMYIADGWYRDGLDPHDDRRIDYYNPWAMHLYALLYAKYRPDDARAARFRHRATAFALHHQHWFEASSGANVPYGRSLLYRSCSAAFWGALALNDIEALPYGIMKGLYLRNLRWWASQRVSRKHDGILTLGYSYPNQMVCERYSSPGSPYWACKAFLPLMLPDSHPFWQAEELPLTTRESIYASPVVGMVFMHEADHTILLVSGPETSLVMRGMSEKYCKFAYSSRYGFSINSDASGFNLEAHDSMIAFSDDGLHYRTRDYIIPRPPWHLRVHKIWTPHKLSTIEGGFAVSRSDFEQDVTSSTDRSPTVQTAVSDDFSGIIDMSPLTARKARVHSPHGNTNVMSSRTIVPQLLGDVEAGVTTVLACAVLAGPDATAMQTRWETVPTVPSMTGLEQLFTREGREIDLYKSRPT